MDAPPQPRAWNKQSLKSQGRGEVSKIESVLNQIAELKSRRDVTTDEAEREDLGEAIQSMAMGWQFRNAESNEVADMRSLSLLIAA